MRLYKAKYTDRKTGRRKKTRNYYIDFRDHTQTRRRIPLTDKRDESEHIKILIRDLVDNRRDRRQDDRTITERLAALPKTARERLEKVPGLLNVTASSDHRLLTEHIEAFEKYLRATRSERTGRFRTERQVKQIIKRIMKVFKGCSFTFWPDVETTKIRECLGNMRGRGNKPLTVATYNKYTQALRQFDNWMEESGRTPKSKLKNLKRLAEKKSKEQAHRGLNYTEVCKLIETTARSPVHFGLTGIQRAAAYIIAMETGYRAGELRALRRVDFDLDAAVVRLSGKYTKNSENAEQYIKQSRAAQLKQYFAGLKSADRALCLPSKYNMADMIRDDCRRAGISTDKIVFHSLRNTLATGLDRARATAKEANWIMRHADKDLRQRSYTDRPSAEELRKVINRLPDYPWPESEDTRGKEDSENVRRLLQSA